MNDNRNIEDAISITEGAKGIVKKEKHMKRGGGLSEEGREKSETNMSGMPIQ